MLDVVSDTIPGLPPIDTWVMTRDELQTVFGNSKRGDVVVYAVGDLGDRRVTARGRQWLEAEQTAHYAYDLHERGLAHLVQKRHGPNRAEYMIVKCR